MSIHEYIHQSYLHLHFNFANFENIRFRAKLPKMCTLFVNDYNNGSIRSLFAVFDEIFFLPSKDDIMVFHRSKLQLPIAVEREDTSNALHRFFSIPLCSRLPYRSDRRKGSVKILKPLANAFTTLDKRRINMSYQYSSKSKTCALKGRKINFTMINDIFEIFVRSFLLAY